MSKKYRSILYLLGLKSSKWITASECIISVAFFRTFFGPTTRILDIFTGCIILIKAAASFGICQTTFWIGLLSYFLLPLEYHQLLSWTLPVFFQLPCRFQTQLLTLLFLSHFPLNVQTLQQELIPFLGLFARFQVFSPRFPLTFSCPSLQQLLFFQSLYLFP